MATAQEWFVSVAGTDPVMQGLVGGLIIALFNALGALLITVWRNPSQRSLDGTLGFAAGVMLSAAYTSLLLPGIDFATDAGYRGLSVFGFEVTGVLPVLVGFVLGVVVLDAGDAWMPKVQRIVTGRRVAVEDEDRFAGVLLFIVAITLHNVPEGLAVGVGFGSGNLPEALALMLAIGIQNVPEGLAVSISARNAGLGSLFYAGVAGLRAGLVEIPVAVIGALAVTTASFLLPYAMGFAAGGMLFVISHEIVPQTHARGNEHVATAGLMAGIVVMLTLDVVLAA